MNTAEHTHKIGLGTATIICMNAMIGAGIFSTPAKLALSVGPAGIISYLFVIFAVLCMALSLARVAQLYPHEGSFYAYTKQWAGHTGGIIAAGAYVIGVVIALGLLTQIAGAYLHEFIPSVSTELLSTGILITIVILNMIGVKFVQAGQLFLIACTLFSLIATSIICLRNAHIANLTPFMPFGISSVFSATKMAIFAFFGFESAASLFTIVENPQRNIPKALTFSILIVGTIYMLFIGSILLALPAATFTDARMPLSLAIARTFPDYAWLAQAIGISILTALLGVLQSMLYSVSMLMQSFIKLLHNNAAQKLIQHKYSFQIILLAIGAWTLINSLVVKNIDLFFSLTALFIVFAYSMSILTLVFKNLLTTKSQKIVTFLGLLTAAIIFVSAFIDFMQAIRI
jgi:amino acid transporter